MRFSIGTKSSNAHTNGHIYHCIVGANYELNHDAKVIFEHAYDSVLHTAELCQSWQWDKKELVNVEGVKPRVKEFIEKMGGMKATLAKMAGFYKDEAFPKFVKYIVDKGHNPIEYIHNGDAMPYFKPKTNFIVKTYEEKVS